MNSTMTSTTRRTTRKRNPSVALQVQKYLRKHAERKFFEHALSTLVDVTWGIDAVSQPIIQSITGGGRIGDSITYVNLRIVGRITANATASVCNFRLVVVLDKMNNGVAPVYTDLMLDNSIDSTYDVEQIKTKRFTILLDKSYALNTAGVAAHMWNQTIRLNQTAFYLGATNATASNGKNSMWAFYVSDNSANKASLNCNFQIEFTDV